MGISSGIISTSTHDFYIRYAVQSDDLVSFTGEFKAITPMKKLIMLVFTAAAMIGCQSSGQEAESGEASGTLYGEAFEMDGANDINWLSENVMSGDSIPVKLTGEITSTCAMKGCWMKLKGPEQDVRVVFKDYGFFVPKEGVEGKEAVLEGYAVRKITDVETLKHMAKDAGKSEDEIAAITEPKEELIVTANGVVIR